MRFQANTFRANVLRRNVYYGYVYYGLVAFGEMSTANKLSGKYVFWANVFRANVLQINLPVHTCLLSFADNCLWGTLDNWDGGFSFWKPPILYKKFKFYGGIRSIFQVWKLSFNKNSFVSNYIPEMDFFAPDSEPEVL
jgi:hypothetical protein